MREITKYDIKCAKRFLKLCDFQKWKCAWRWKTDKRVFNLCAIAYMDEEMTSWKWIDWMIKKFQRLDLMFIDEAIEYIKVQKEFHLKNQNKMLDLTIDMIWKSAGLKKLDLDICNVEFLNNNQRVKGILKFDKGSNLFVLNANNFEFTMPAGDNEIQKTNLLIHLIQNFHIQYK